LIFTKAAGQKIADYPRINGIMDELFAHPAASEKR
jgi:hypothetical protein